MKCTTCDGNGDVWGAIGGTWPCHDCGGTGQVAELPPAMVSVKPLNLPEAPEGWKWHAGTYDGRPTVCLYKPGEGARTVVWVAGDDKMSSCANECIRAAEDEVGYRDNEWNEIFSGPEPEDFRAKPKDELPPPPDGYKWHVFAGGTKVVPYRPGTGVHGGWSHVDRICKYGAEEPAYVPYWPTDLFGPEPPDFRKQDTASDLPPPPEGCKWHRYAREDGPIYVFLYEPGKARRTYVFAIARAEAAALDARQGVWSTEPWHTHFGPEPPDFCRVEPDKLPDGWKLYEGVYHRSDGGTRPFMVGYKPGHAEHTRTQFLDAQPRHKAIASIIKDIGEPAFLFCGWQFESPEPEDFGRVKLEKRVHPTTGLVYHVPATGEARTAKCECRVGIHMCPVHGMTSGPPLPADGKLMYTDAPLWEDPKLKPMEDRSKPAPGWPAPEMLVNRGPFKNHYYAERQDEQGYVRARTAAQVIAMTWAWHDLEKAGKQ